MRRIDLAVEAPDGGRFVSRVGKHVVKDPIRKLRGRGEDSVALVELVRGHFYSRRVVGAVDRESVQREANPL